VSLLFFTTSSSGALAWDVGQLALMIFHVYFYGKMRVEDDSTNFHQRKTNTSGQNHSSGGLLEPTIVDHYHPSLSSL